MQNQEMTSLYKWGRIVLTCLAVFLIVLVLNGLKELRQMSPIYNSITVTGEGEAVAVPDVAAFTFSVSADAASVAAAQEAVTKKVDAVLAALEDAGIDEKDIKTTDYSVWPKYIYKQQICTVGYCPGNQVQDGYTANESVSVKVRETEKAGEALAAAGDNGATNLSGLSFTLDNPDEVRNEARGKAIADARKKAEVLSRQLGVRLVRVIGYYDSSDSGNPVPYYAERSAAGDSVMLQNKAPTLPTGENKTTISVSVVYQIR